MNNALTNHPLVEACRPFFLFLSLFVILSLPGYSQDTLDTKGKIRLVAERVIKDAAFEFTDQKTGAHYKSADKAPGDAKLRIESGYNDWRYWNGVLNLGMLDAAEFLHERSYADFVSRNIAFSFDNYRYFEVRHKDEGKWDYPFGPRFKIEELDDCGAMGASLIEVYRREKQARYREYIEQAASFILTQEYRLDDSTFVRPNPWKWTLWADDLYMSVSFLSRMGELTGDRRYFDEAARQVINFHKHLFDETRGLMDHYWYSAVDRQGVAFWGRANGWAMMAQVNLLDRLPKSYPMRDTLISLLRRHILGVAHYQSGTGLWRQLLDKTDSFLETSCTAMITYTVARAVNKGYIDARYASIARRGWEGVASMIQPDGQLVGVSAGTGVSDDVVYYYRRPTPLNDPHGTGAVLMAGVEVMQLPR